MSNDNPNVIARNPDGSPLQSARVSVNNSTTTPPTVASPFVGGLDDITDFVGITMTLATEQSAAHSGTLIFEFSPDNGAHWDVSVQLDYSSAEPFIPFPLRKVQTSFRVRYVPNDDNLTAFRLQVIYHRLVPETLTRLFIQDITMYEPVKVVRAGMMAENDAGTRMENLVASRRGLRVEAAGTLGPLEQATYGGLVVESRSTQISADFITGIPEIVESTISNGGTTVQLNGSAILSTGSDPNGTARLQTVSRTAYASGREIYATFTSAFTTPTSVSSGQHSGLFDDTNGFFIGYGSVLAGVPVGGTTFGVVLRTLGVDTPFIRSAWNGDPLDGSTTSKFRRDNQPEPIDFTKRNIYRIRFGWLGNAPIQFEVLSPDGVWCVFHTVREPNTFTVPSIANPQLPITMETTKHAADATDLRLSTSSWDAGVVANLVGQQSRIRNSGTPVSVSNSAALLVAENTARKGLIITNIGPGVVRFGTSDLTSMSGVPLFVGEKASFIMPACPINAMYAIRQDTVDSTVVAVELV